MTHYTLEDDLISAFVRRGIVVRKITIHSKGRLYRIEVER